MFATRTAAYQIVLSVFSLLAVCVHCTHIHVYTFNMHLICSHKNLNKLITQIKSVDYLATLPDSYRSPVDVPACCRGRPMNSSELTGHGNIGD